MTPQRVMKNLAKVKGFEHAKPKKLTQTQPYNEPEVCVSVRVRLCISQARRRFKSFYSTCQALCPFLAHSSAYWLLSKFKVTTESGRLRSPMLPFQKAGPVSFAQMIKKEYNKGARESPTGEHMLCMHGQVRTWSVPWTQLVSPKHWGKSSSWALSGDTTPLLCCRSQHFLCKGKPPK